MKKMLNRALSVLFAILTIVSLCTSPIMAEEVETYAGCTHTNERIRVSVGYTYSQYNDSTHIRREIVEYICGTCGVKFGVITPGTDQILSHEYNSPHPTNDGSWIYMQDEYHSGAFHFYLYQTHCRFCGHAFSMYHPVKCTLCLPNPPF